jgi:hypothetical protein
MNVWSAYHQIQGLVEICFTYHNELFVAIKDGECLDQMIDCQLLNKETALVMSDFWMCRLRETGKFNKLL